jgi:hypothetical protein
MMRTPRPVSFVIGGTLIALAAMSGAAHAQAQAEAQKQTTLPDVRPPAGAHLVPYVGVSSFLGSSGKGLGPGFRAGAIGGGHVNPMFSVNGEITIDLLNPSSSAGDYTGLNLDLALSPFVHVPLKNFELVFGPKLGAWFGAINTSVAVPLLNMNMTARSREHGWLAGLNAGGFLSLNHSVELGALLSFLVRSPTSACADTNVPTPGPEICTGSNLSSGKVLAFSIALLF